MKAERQYKEATSRVIQPSKGGGRHIVDNRPQLVQLTPAYGVDRDIIDPKVIL